MGSLTVGTEALQVREPAVTARTAGRSAPGDPGRPHANTARDGRDSKPTVLRSGDEYPVLLVSMTVDTNDSSEPVWRRAP